MDCDCFENCEEINLCSHHDILAEIDGNTLVKCAENNLKKVNNKDNTKENTIHTHNTTDKCNPAFRCMICEFFDRYDMCFHKENFGSITQKSLDNCKNQNLLKEKPIQ